MFRIVLCKFSTFTKGFICFHRNAVYQTALQSQGRQRAALRSVSQAGLVLCGSSSCFSPSFWDKSRQNKANKSVQAPGVQTSNSYIATFTLSYCPEQVPHPKASPEAGACILAAVRPLCAHMRQVPACERLRGWGHSWDLGKRREFTLRHALKMWKIIKYFYNKLPQELSMSHMPLFLEY